jgi:hypothetical protein
MYLKCLFRVVNHCFHNAKCVFANSRELLWILMFVRDCFSATELIICGLFMGSRRIIDGINHMKELGKQGLARERVEKVRITLKFGLAISLN